ncbi:ABC transporter permease [Microbacterium sp. STN6]|uniref:ABC transporter permease n=1 Tax=Microbacterium sp. STN6 TaxID=2995588 RepID=UPI002260E4C3|nr:ABC transporter permease [Microbacterium sp. STN6]MCX7521984.1 ABC transporter permease [Microbacterium sp. STN6]
MTTAEAKPQPRTPFQRYRHSLWLLTKRDLRVRYATSALGYLWSILDPLLMAAIYFFVFVYIFHRGGVGENPYIVFLLSAMLPWVWFNGSISDSCRAYLREAKLVRSTTIPRTIWVNRIVLSKGIEYVASLPVLAIFAIAFGAPVSWDALLFYPLAIVLQIALTVGLGFIVAPLVVFFRDLERAVKLILRLMFYGTPIIYAANDVPGGFHKLTMFNPLNGIFSLYRAPFFPQALHWPTVGVAIGMTAVILVIGIAVFARTERAVLKEI